MTESSFVFLFPEEAALAGPEALAAMVAELGFGGVAVALVYHRGRRVLPRYGRVSVSAPGHVAFEPVRERYGALVPERSAGLDTVRAVHALRAACDRHGLRFRAWLVALHHEGLVRALPEAGAETVDGSPVGFSLCPSHPETAAYCAALVDDVCAQFEPAAVELEAATFPGWEPAYTLTLALAGLSARARRFGAQCFCRSCRSALAAAGEDPEAVAAAAAGAAGPPFAAVGERRVDALERRLVELRAGILAPLLAAAAGRAHARRARMDAYAFGDPAAFAMQGFSASALAGVDGVLLGLGSESGDRVLTALAGLRELAPDHPATASLNWAPGRSPSALAADVQAVLAAGAAGVGLYNLSLVPQYGLAALAAAAAAARSGAAALEESV